MPDVPERKALSAQRKRFWFEHGADGNGIQLREGVLLVGRSSSCHLVLDDAMVSRRHAQIIVGREGVRLEDFGSVNGVYVNGRRIEGVHTLREGDHVQIGTQEFVLRASLLSERVRPNERLMAETLNGVPVPREFLGRSVPAPVLEAEPTFSAHTLDLLGGLVDKVLALGRGEEAERILSSTLTNVLNEAKQNRAAGTEIYDRAASYAVRLAEATGKGRWIDYALELFAALRRPLPVQVVNDLYEVLNKTSNINLSALREYVEMLRNAQQTFGPSERFVLQRLEGLERIAALR